jgi:WD40 repeat protein
VQDTVMFDSNFTLQVINQSKYGTVNLENLSDNSNNIMDNEITFFNFDDQHRKLIVGDHNGNIKIFDLLSGVQIGELEPHTGEISYIGYGGKDRTLITCSWDKIIKIHMDDKNDNPKELVLRGKANCHNKDIISSDYSHNLGLIATGSK